ncbi:hypothetical protein, partial [Porphyromonas sp.]|uniref:hypothetical protein n=1 Tax=Porphyromonas sp. TaxID=1924944 RepID=UPI0026DB7469
MELTTSKKSAFISEMLSSGQVLTSLSVYYRTPFRSKSVLSLSKSMRENNAMASVLVTGEATDVALNY